MEGIAAITVGLLFIASYFWDSQVVILRPFTWLCESFSWPATRKMAFFYGAGGIVAGLSMLSGKF